MQGIDWTAEGDRCVALLQELIRIPTVNRGKDSTPEGHERPAAERLAELFRAEGLEPRLLEPEAGRTSVIARIKGTGDKPPLLLTGHLDVVEADASRWRHDPFAGEIHDGCVWGRGAIDMKHMVAMSSCVMALLARGAHGRKLTRDVIFAGVADEEAGSAKGSFFLVDEHPDLVRAEYALGEIGAFSLHLFGRTFYPIQIAEKGVCWVKATFHGEPGHGSMPDPNSAVIKLGRAIARLGKSRLPMHPTEAVELSFARIAAELPQPQRAVLGRLTTPQLAGIILDHLVREPDQRRSFGALLSNTATPTVVRAGAKSNVIPSLASVEIDGRTLPGQSTADFLVELREALGSDGNEASLEVLKEIPPTTMPHQTPMFERLSATLRRHDPLGVPVPFMIPGFTDAKAFSKLGTRCYGFAPVKLDPVHALQFSRMYHGDDERAPVLGLHWGLRVLFDAVADFCCE
jgi:acetylornithine deacetylase/succinyl-diaminopimelate desuccinylase-like protein